MHVYLHRDTNQTQQKINTHLVILTNNYNSIRIYTYLSLSINNYNNIRIYTYFAASTNSNNITIYTYLAASTKNNNLGKRASSGRYYQHLKEVQVENHQTPMGQPMFQNTYITNLSI